MKTPKYRQIDFYDKLIEMLKEAKDKEGKPKAHEKITARDLHKRVVKSGDVRMRMACRALHRLLKEQGSKALPYEVEFDATALRKSNPTRGTNR